MASIYGHKWTSSYGDHDAGDTWLQALTGVEHAGVMKGLNACVTSKDPWPPSAPEFRGMCLPSMADHGLLDADAAYRLACDHYGRRGDDSRQPLHQTIKYAARAAGGSQQLISSEQKHIFPAFKKAYEHACEQFISGVDLFPEGLALPSGVRKKTPAEEYEANHYAHLDDKRAAKGARDDLFKGMRGK